MPGEVIAEVGVRRQFAAVPSHELAIEHRCDEQVAIGQPTETGWLRFHFDNSFVIAIEINGVHGMVVEVGIPKSAVVPARAFTKEQAVSKDGGAHDGSWAFFTTVRN